VAGTCECGNEPSVSIKCGDFFTGSEPVSFSRRTLLRGVSKCCKSLARPGRKQATATEDFGFHISYL
jgi:hypothetical protein